MRRLLALAVLSFSCVALGTPQFAEKTLSNGLTVVVVENHAQPLVTVEIAVRNGAMTEDEKYNGVSHLYEHMFFKSNAALPNQEAYLERARELGLLWNGTTGTERVNYFFTTTTKHFADAMVFMRDAIVSPTFDPKEFEKERVVVTGEIDRNLSNPYFHLYDDVQRRLWWKYPTRKLALGTRASVLAATPEMMRTIQKRYYVPNNALLVVTGDVRTDAVFASAEALYAGWPMAADPFVAFPLVEHPPLARTEVVLVEQPVETLTATFKWHGPSTQGPSAPATYAADLLGYALAQASSKFQKALVDSGACVSARFSWETQRNVGPVSLDVTALPEKGDTCLSAALAELPRMRDREYLSDEEMKNAVLALHVDFTSQREKPSSLAHTLTFWWASAGLEYYQSYEDEVAKVTRADIARYLDAYVIGKPYVLGVMVSPGAAKSLFGRAQAEALVARAASAPVAASEPAPAPVGVDGDITAWDMNGLEILVKKIPGAEFTVTSLVVKGGVRNWTAGQAGVEALALEAAFTGGTEKLDKDAFARRVESTGSAISTSSTNEFGVLSIKTLKAQFAPGFDLLADAFLTPALPLSEVERVRQRMVTGLRQQLETPDGALEVVEQKALFRGHPYDRRAQGSLASLASLTRDDVVRHIARMRETSRLLLVVAGDVEPEDVFRKARAAFGNLPRGAASFPPLAPPSFTQSGVVVEPRALETNYIAMLFPAPHPGESAEPAGRVAMSLLSYRLFEEVRTKRNLSYAAYAGLDESAVATGLLYVTTVDPSAALKVLADEVVKLKSKPATAKELTDTKEEYLSALVSARETVDAQANSLILWRLAAGDFREARRFPEKIRAVTAADVQAFAKKYLVNMQTAYLGDPAKAPNQLAASAPKP